MDDLISVIVPIYRVEKYLAQCIESIMNQTYSNLEIILVDDGSDDSCGKMCDDFAMADERIVVIHKENQGLNNARKSGLLASSGEYVAYLDGDDWIERNMYEKLLDCIKKDGTDIVESGIFENCKSVERYISPLLEDGKYVYQDFINKVEYRALYTGQFFESAISPYLCNKLFKKKCVEKYQLWEGNIQDVLNDNLVTYPAIIASKSLSVMNEGFYHYRLNNNSIKHTNSNKRDIVLLEAYEGYWTRLKDNFFVDNAKEQILYYCMYHLLCRIPFVFDHKSDNKWLMPYGGIPKQSKVVLYGAGSVGIHLYSYIKNETDIEIIGWLDKKFDSVNEKNPVVSPYEIRNMEYDFVIISIMKKRFVDEVRKNLNELGISEKKIRWIEEDYLTNPQKLLDIAYRYNK